MKTLFFLLIGAFCFAHGQSPPKEDSAIQVVTEKVSTLNKINQENEILIKELIEKKKVEKQSKEIVNRSKSTEDKITRIAENQKSEILEAVKPENIKPIIEVDFKVYSEIIKGGFFYRLFHKDHYKIKYYKIVGDEKVYLN
jgi:hypothetical protein